MAPRRRVGSIAFVVPAKQLAGAAGQIGHVPAPLLEDQLEAGAQGIPPISERRDTPLRLLIRLQIPRKTLAAAVIKLFLRSGNARRVLFLVDRLELEDQAKKAFAALLSADLQTVIYKERDDEHTAIRFRAAEASSRRAPEPWYGHGPAWPSTWTERAASLDSAYPQPDAQ